MRPNAWFLAFLLVASSGASGLVVGRHFGVGSHTDIPTRLQIVDAMADEVGLDLAQRDQVIAISDRHAHQIQDVRRKVASDLAAIRSEVRSETRAIMNDRQKRRFDAYCARRDAQRELADK